MKLKQYTIPTEIGSLHDALPCTVVLCEAWAWRDPVGEPPLDTGETTYELLDLLGSSFQTVSKLR